MTTFITRVELYGSPSEAVYERLHAAMALKGFSRSFTDKGQSYDMPHAMYFSKNPQHTATNQVVQLAISAATTVWKDFAVLVTSTENRIEYHNLKETKK